VDWSQLLSLAGWKLFWLALGNLGVAIGGAVALFKWFGQKWLENRFAKDLEEFKSQKTQALEEIKHERTKEIEAIRRTVQWEYSRISKIHEKEFEVLPEAWFLLHDAHGRTGHLMLALKRYPDFQRLPDVEFEEFLKETRLTETQKDEMRSALDRFQYYSTAMFWIELNDAHSAQVKLNNYIIKHRIFMTPNLQASFTAVSHTLADALIEHRQWKEGLGHELLTSSITKFNALPDTIAEVEKAVQQRLHYDAA
jgi:hypothetical protein